MKKKIRLTESDLIKVIERTLMEAEEIDDHVESKQRDANPIAKKAFDDVVGHLEATKGAFSLRNKSMTENLEDDKLKKTWKWKTNDGKVGVTVTVDVKMND
jgi:predicted transcriptional regulator